MGFLEATILIMIAMGCAATAAVFVPVCGALCWKRDDPAVRGAGDEPQEASSPDGSVPFRSQLTSWEWLLVDAAPCCGRREETLAGEMPTDSADAIGRAKVGAGKCLQVPLQGVVAPRGVAAHVDGTVGGLCGEL